MVFYTKARKDVNVLKLWKSRSVRNTAEPPSVSNLRTITPRIISKCNNVEKLVGQEIFGFQLDCNVVSGNNDHRALENIPSTYNFTGWETSAKL